MSSRGKGSKSLKSPIRRQNTKKKKKNVKVVSNKVSRKKRTKNPNLPDPLFTDGTFRKLASVAGVSSVGGTIHNMNLVKSNQMLTSILQIALPLTLSKNRVTLSVMDIVDAMATLGYLPDDYDYRPPYE